MCRLKAFDPHLNDDGERRGRMRYEYGEYGVFGYGGFLVDPRYVADMPLVGSRIEKTDSFCGVFSRSLGCLESWLHVGKVPRERIDGQLTFDGKVPKGVAVVFVRAYHCTDPLCMSCCLHWAKMETSRAIRRFEAFDEQFADEFDDFVYIHSTVSVPEKDYGLSVKRMRGRAISMIKKAGVVGGNLFYHPKRYDRDLGIWYYSPHFHVLGVAKDGMLDGEWISDNFERTGYVIKNLGARFSLVGTLMYQLSHAGVPDKGHVVTWFGEMGYVKGEGKRKLEVVDEFKPSVCPICGNKLVHVCRVVGASSFDYRKFEDKFILDSVENWCVAPDSDDGG